VRTEDGRSTMAAAACRMSKRLARLAGPNRPGSPAAQGAPCAGRGVILEATITEAHALRRDFPRRWAVMSGDGR
jgi:hypothetical protein